MIMMKNKSVSNATVMVIPILLTKKLASAAKNSKDTGRKLYEIDQNNFSKRSLMVNKLRFN